VARSASLLQRRIVEAHRAARAVAVAGLSAIQFAAIDRVRDACVAAPAQVSRSPLERADREDEIAGWLARHGAAGTAAEALADTGVTLDALDTLAQAVTGDALDAALAWIAADGEIRTLATETERAGSRISELVGAMKRLTYMDRAPVPEPLALEQGLRDTLVILTRPGQNP
jgi:hypothetical protein